VAAKALSLAAKLVLSDLVRPATQVIAGCDDGYAELDRRDAGQARCRRL